MNRKAFLSSLLLLPLFGKSMHLTSLHNLAAGFPASSPFPVLFLGHGSPMNAIEENEFVAGFRQLAVELPKPNAILCISAHWETKGTFFTAMEKPKTIHDFGGFPQALFDVQYPAPGSPALALEAQTLIQSTSIGLDVDWGLDHGAWSVIKHLYPAADVPVVQMSIDYRQGPAFHYALGRELRQLRRKGVLIIGSGNMVHNLRLVDWQRVREVGYAYDWAAEAQEKMSRHILQGTHEPLIAFAQQGRAFQLAIPTPEHFIPLLYTLALQEKEDEATLFNDQSLAGSLSMTSVKIQRRN